MLTAILVPALSVSAKSDDAHRHTRTEVFVLDAEQINSLGTSSRMGHIQITPRATPPRTSHQSAAGGKIPKWIRPIKDGVPSFNPATDVVVVAQGHAEQPGWLDDTTLEPVLAEGVLTLKAQWADADHKRESFGVDDFIRIPRWHPSTPRPRWEMSWSATRRVP